MRPYQERRLKAFCVNPKCLDDYLRRYDEWPSRMMFGMLEHDELPPDAVLLEVTHDYARRGLIAVYSHSSFPEVPFGEQTPIANGSFCHLRVRVLERQDDGSYRSSSLEPAAPAA